MLRRCSLCWAVALVLGCVLTGTSTAQRAITPEELIISSNRSEILSGQISVQPGSVVLVADAELANPSQQPSSIISFTTGASFQLNGEVQLAQPGASSDGALLTLLNVLLQGTHCRLPI